VYTWPETDPQQSVAFPVSVAEAPLPITGRPRPCGSLNTRSSRINETYSNVPVKRVVGYGARVQETEGIGPYGVRNRSVRTSLAVRSLTPEITRIG
jgi:hypothetical protein